jgi:hypothetical protein
VAFAGVSGAGDSGVLLLVVGIGFWAFAGRRAVFRNNATARPRGKNAVCR